MRYHNIYFSDKSAIGEANTRSNSKMNVEFTGKVVLVTGASAGIGEAIALLFAKLGANLALVGRNEVNLADVAKRCEAEKNLPPLAIVADLATDAGCEKVAKETIARFGRLDVLINNAGVGARTTLQTTDMDTFDRVFNTNVRGVYNLTRLLVHELVKTKGNIVNISSIAATVTVVGSLPYGMSKAALDHFTRLTSLELAPKGVRVNTVSPGYTESKFVIRITDITDEQYKEFLKEAAKTVPMGQVCTGDDIARMVVFIASDNCPLVTGAVVQVDGSAQFGNMSSILLKK